MSADTAPRLGRELFGYILSAQSSSSKQQQKAPSYAALLPVSNPNASSPIATLRGTCPHPSHSSWSIVPSNPATSAMMVHADSDRPLIHIHTYQATAGSVGSNSQTCQLSARLHPPEVTPTVQLSPSGKLIAAGSSSGRIFVWHLPSGRMVASLDAHFRPVTCLVWTADESCLVSAGDDARILVWSMETLSKSAKHANDISESTPSVPYAVLADHVQGISSISLSSSGRATFASFPSSLRIISASKDGTVKLWDVRTRSLISTWSFQGPISHLAVDTGFRAFYITVRGREIGTSDDDIGAKPKTTSHAGPLTQSEFIGVHRMDLYEESIHASTAVNASAATATHVRTDPVWKANAGTTVTSMTLTSAGSLLLLGTSEGQLHVLDVESTSIVRNISLYAAGQDTKGLEVVGLHTVTLQDSHSLLQGASSRGNAANGAWDIAEKLQHTRDAPNGLIKFRLHRTPISETCMKMTPPSMVSKSQQISPHLESPSTLAEAPDERIASLTRDNERLNQLLQRAQKTNSELWEQVVHGASQRVKQ